MKYKNTKTGAVIETSTKVSGENWEPVDTNTVDENVDEDEDQSNESEMGEEKKTRGRKKKEEAE